MTHPWIVVRKDGTEVTFVTMEAAVKYAKEGK